jgi:hypothetical protein
VYWPRGVLQGGAQTWAWDAGYNGFYNGAAWALAFFKQASIVAGIIGSLPFGGGAAAAEGAAGMAEEASALAAGNGSGVTVLGSFPEYVLTAERLGANYFSVPAEEWAEMSAAEQWAANQAFLDAAIARGDSFVFSNSLAPAGSFFERELQYLMQQRVFLGVPP